LTKIPQIYSRILPFCASLFCFLSGVSAYAQPVVYENGQPTLIGSDASVHVDNQFRRKIDLAGTWTYTIDNETWKDVKIPASFDSQGRITFMRKF